VQLAKAARWNRVLAGAPYTVSRPKDVILTGSFGAVLRAEWLKTIGILIKTIQTTRFTPEGALAGVESSCQQRRFHCG
jgi:hypothetical protein